MIFLLQHLFLLATDLLLATTLSCLFYAFVCISIASLACFIILFSFGILERNIDVKGRAIVILVSNSSIGRMFARNLDKAGFRVSAAHWPPREEGTATEEECSSSMEVAQLHMTEDEYQKTVKTFIESHLSLKGSAEEGHFGSQSVHHEASPTADSLQRGEASSRPEVPVVRSCETLHGSGCSPSIH
ncbi:estradiol 17-beta-dehydrogenase 2-like isoform X2 [Strigops habroptila]|uniref:estradiol 17-beta-dehydrogenase 2-like isoform X2 n=1 Tax=Strigops habroptila TaxID=2489341 RepID=UPI0011CFF8A5|nr:estradiol 17-beta-dehydrogenase 2-like isoform X2 [Strigops habroptila]